MTGHCDFKSSTSKTALQIPPEMDKRRPNFWKLVVCALGIFVCYFFYGIFQEKITRGKYGVEQEPFVYTQSLVFVQCVSNALFAKAVLLMNSSGAVDNTPTYLYCICAFTYMTAMITSNWALRYVAYPTQVIGKSCKPIPVMLLGVLLARKRYSLIKYCCVLIIIAGVSLFFFKDSSAQHRTAETHSTFGMGELLLVVSLTMDGLTGGVQDKIRGNYLCKSQSMMLQMNLWSMLFSAIGILVTGEAIQGYSFVHRHPEVLYYMMAFSLASAFGQYFIFMTVTEFSPLTCSIITTTRKFFTILASVILFNNPISRRQWFGATLVFVGLALDSLYGKQKTAKEERFKPHTAVR